MNLVEMTQICEAGYALRGLVRDFYSLEFDGKYGETYQFTDEEIIDGINIYFKDDIAWKEIVRCGADTKDVERIFNIVTKDLRGE